MIRLQTSTMALPFGPVHKKVPLPVTMLNSKLELQVHVHQGVTSSPRSAYVAELAVFKQGPLAQEAGVFLTPLTQSPAPSETLLYNFYLCRTPDVEILTRFVVVSCRTGCWAAWAAT